MPSNLSVLITSDGGSASKVDDVIPSRAVQDGGYALPWQRYDNKMAAIHNKKTIITRSVYTTAKVQSERVIDVFYIFNSTVIDWTFVFLIVFQLTPAFINRLMLVQSVTVLYCLLFFWKFFFQSIFSPSLFSVHSKRQIPCFSFSPYVVKSQQNNQTEFRIWTTSFNP